MSEDQISTVQHVVRTGNSLAVVVPARFVNQSGVQSGDKVDVSVNYDEGKITYTFLSIRQLNLV